MKKSTLLLTGLSILLAAVSCKKEDDSCTTTYQDVKPIIEKSCAYAGCHAGADAGPWVTAEAKDYTNYEGLKAGLLNGKFDDRALVQKNMPPAEFVTEGHPKALTEDEIALLTCWSENGHPEN